MQLRKLLDSPCGLRFMIDNLCTHSSYSRKIMLESSMMYDKNAIENTYSVMKEFYEVIKNDENKNIVQSLQFKLCNLKDINHTISRLATSVVIDDIELYEVKSLALLSADVKNILEKISLDKIIAIPNLDDVVKILDPDGLRIATFYIYDSYSEAMTSALNALADVDINIAKLLQMKELGLCFPTISLKNISSYKGIFHPEVKSILEKEKREYQKVDIDFGLKPLIIMGSNMGGKTIVLKTLAMCQYLLQFGFGVPATSADMMIYDEIFCLTTDDQSINKGLSSFAAEMKNIDAVIKSSQQNKKILALIDEPARTTNPTEGTALVSSLVKLLQDRAMSLVIVTHYNIKTYNNKCLRVKGLIDGKMNYELVETHEGEVPHEALNIAETLGIDSQWIEMAKEIISVRS